MGGVGDEREGFQYYFFNSFGNFTQYGMNNIIVKNLKEMRMRKT